MERKGRLEEERMVEMRRQRRIELAVEAGEQETQADRERETMRESRETRSELAVERENEEMESQDKKGGDGGDRWEES